MLFKKKPSLRNQYDASLLKLMAQTKRDWEYAKKIEQSVFEKDSLLYSQTKLAEVKYFYLFKEARNRDIKGDTTTL
ncbi:YaaL family protein [Carnobacterium sp.]|uniref:YaaL family protein n=1 Tax=Carnobacterium sp. TaxID=48221 RepID=UPI0028AD512B|nr:YaaL family protein [Carnobacterium sp.]